MRLGDRVTVLTPHAPEVPEAWEEDGVTVRSFRYAPASMELIGYSRSLSADERPRLGAALVTPLYLLGSARALRAELARRSYDLVHAHWVVPNGVSARRASAGVPLAIGLHGSDVFMAEKAGARTLARAALARARLLTGCSPELVDRVCALGFPEEKARVIPYGVDVTTFFPGPDRSGTWRRDLGIPDAATVVVSVGRMVTKKGYQVLLPELGELLHRHPEVHFVLGGTGDRLEEFRRAAAGWAGRVHFPGVVMRDRLPDLYRAADLFVLPAVHDPKGNVDGLPNVILEAMASGLPVVASEISGIPLAVRHGREGLLVPEKDGVALREALSELIGDAEARTRMGAAARHRAEAELTWDVVAARYRTAYVETLESRS